MTCSGCPAEVPTAEQLEHGEWRRKGRQLFWSTSRAENCTDSFLFVFVGLFYMVCFWDTFDSEMFSVVLKSWTHLNKQMLGKCPANLSHGFLWSGVVGFEAESPRVFRSGRGLPVLLPQQPMRFIGLPSLLATISWLSDQLIRFFMHILYQFQKHKILMLYLTIFNLPLSRASIFNVFW